MGQKEFSQQRVVSKERDLGRVAPLDVGRDEQTCPYSTNRWNVWICVRSKLPWRDNGMGRLRSGRTLGSQRSLRRLHPSGPHQQSCGPPQVRTSAHAASFQFKANGCNNRRKWALTLFSFSSFPTDGTWLSLKTTPNRGRLWFLFFFEKKKKKIWKPRKVLILWAAKNIIGALLKGTEEMHSLKSGSLKSSHAFMEKIEAVMWSCKDWKCSRSVQLHKENQIPLNNSLLP